MDAEAAREFLLRYQKMIEDLWLEREAFRRLILDASAISEAELAQLAEGAKNNPENRELAAKNFATSRKALAEFVLGDVIQKLASNPPTTDKQN